MRKIGLIANPNKDTGFKVANQVINLLINELDCKIYCDEEVATVTDLNHFILTKENVKECAFVVVIGGDGTMLRALKTLSHTDIAIIGINMGNMGFLTHIEVENITKDLTDIFAGRYEIDNRMMVSLYDGEKLCGNALNEILFKKMIGCGVGQFKVYVGGHLLAHYIADGVLISTPTGSTAYALSAGGPIIDPKCKNILIQPISPHSLNSRAIVLSPNQEVVVEYEKDRDSKVFIDGYEYETSSTSLIVRKSEKSINLVKQLDYDFYNVLFHKIKQPNYFRGGIS